MAPSKRERDEARRQHAAELRRRQEQEAARRRRRRLVLSVGGGVLAVALVAVVVVTATSGGDDTAAAPTPSTSALPSPSPSASPVADNPCPVPEQTAADPLTFDAAPEPGSSDATSAVIATSCGDIAVELYPQEAPQAVASFDFLAGEGYFDGTPCHRLVTAGIFVLQCGDPTATGTGGPGYSFGPVENAPADDLYPAGTLAMARQPGDGSSNGSQFFLVYEDSPIPSDAAGGYTVFGRVTDGLDIVQTIAEGGNAADGTAPARPISIEGVTTQ